MIKNQPNDSIQSTLDNIPPRLISELRRMSTEHLDPQYDDPSLDFDPQTDRNSRSAMRILSGLPMAGGVMTGPETILSLVRNPESEENQAYVRENRALLRAFPLLKQLYGYSREVDPTDYIASTKLDVEKDEDIEDFSKMFGRDNLPKEYQYTTDVRKQHDIKSEINRLHTLPKEIYEPTDESMELRQRGGIVGYQEGGDVLLQETDPEGFVGSPEEAVVDQVDAAQNGDMGGDNVDAEVPEGSFVLNSYAVELAGIKDIEKLIDDAKKYILVKTRESGFVSPTGEDVEVRVSEGEYIIPPALVKIIGKDRLEKINNRGIVEFERQQAEETERGGEEMPQEPQGFVPPQEGDVAQTDPRAFSPEAEIPNRSNLPVSRPELVEPSNFEQGGFVGYALGGGVPPQAQQAQQAPQVPQATQVPQAPQAPQAQQALQAPQAPQATQVLQAPQAPGFSEDTFRLALMSSPPKTPTTRGKPQQRRGRGFVPNAQQQQQQQQRIAPGAPNAPATSLPVSNPLSVGSKKKFHEGGLTGFADVPIPQDKPIPVYTAEEDEFNSEVNKVDEESYVRIPQYKPPRIHNSAEDAEEYGGLEQPATPFRASPEFTEYMISVENIGSKGFKNGKWYPYPSKGLNKKTHDEIGYGIEIEKGKYTNGITQKELDVLFKERLTKASKEARMVVDNQLGEGTFDSISSRKQEALVDFAYNLGGGKYNVYEDTKTGLTKYEKFIDALVKDKEGIVQKEFIRNERDKQGNLIPIVRRNEMFKDFFPEFFPVPHKQHGGFISAI